MAPRHNPSNHCLCPICLNWYNCAHCLKSYPDFCESCSLVDPSTHSDFINGCRSCGYISPKHHALVRPFHRSSNPVTPITAKSSLSSLPRGYKKLLKTFVEQYPSVNRNHICAGKRKTPSAVGLHSTLPRKERALNPVDAREEEDAEVIEEMEDDGADNETGHGWSATNVNIIDLITPQRERHGIAQDFQLIPRPRRVLDIDDGVEKPSLSFPPLPYISSSSIIEDTSLDWEFVPVSPSSKEMSQWNLSYADALLKSQHNHSILGTP